MAVAEENRVLDNIVEDFIIGFENSSERERLKKVLIHGGDFNSREYVSKRIREFLRGEVEEVIATDEFENIPNTYTCDLSYFLEQANSSAT